MTGFAVFALGFVAGCVLGPLAFYALVCWLEGRDPPGGADGWSAE